MWMSNYSDEFKRDAAHQITERKAPAEPGAKSRLRHLNEHMLSSLRHARHLIAAWRDDYNHHRPHTSLDGLIPREFLNRSAKDQSLNRTNF